MERGGKKAKAGKKGGGDKTHGVKRERSNSDADSSRKAQFTQAKLARKSRKPDAELLEDAKRIYNVVKPNDKALVEGGDREALIADLLKMIKGRAAKLVLKHDASRIVQTCVKHGTSTQRQEIIDELKDHLLAITKSRYGKFLAVKLFVYGSPAQRKTLLAQIHGKARRMMKQKDSSEVLEHAFSEVMNAAERQQTLFEIYAPDVSRLPGQEPVPLAQMMASADTLKHKQICDELDGLLERWINKELLRNSVVHAIMWEYVQCMPETRREQLIASLRELVPHFLHTRDGARVAQWMATHGAAKDRKAMMKAIKPFALATALDEFGCMVLVRLLDVTDDTKSASAMLLKPLLETPEGLESIITSPSGSLVLLHIFSPADPKYFSQVQREALAVTSVSSKKDPAQRRQELLATVLSPVADLLVGAAVDEPIPSEGYGEDKLMNGKHAANVTFECACTAGSEEVSTRLLSALSTMALNNPHVLDFFHTSRLFKRIIVTALPGVAKPHGQFVLDLWTSLAQQGRDHVLELVACKGAGFVVVALLENPVIGPTLVHKFLRGCLSELQKVETPAARIIVKKVSGKQ